MAAGGNLTVKVVGEENRPLNEDATETFWDGKYQHYTNFGTQTFQLDSIGMRTLSLTESSTFEFPVDRNADLLKSCALEITLPTIWSPILPPQPIEQDDGTIAYTPWSPYEFRWIKNIGAQIIKEVRIQSNNVVMQKFSGSYIEAMVQRDFTATQRDEFDGQTGNVPELNDPKNADANDGNYPNAYYTNSSAGAEPSIPGRTIFVPIPFWFANNTRQAFPLIATANDPIRVVVTFRPISEWFQIRDVEDYQNGYPYVAPNFNNPYMQFYRFLQTPPDVGLTTTAYADKRTLWQANISLKAEYTFLTKREKKKMELMSHTYLIKQVREYTFYDVAGAKTVELIPMGMVASWMFFFQRNDVNLRNEWSNYTNWPYNQRPSTLVPAPSQGGIDNPGGSPATIGPGMDVDGASTGLKITGVYTPDNQETVLVDCAIKYDGINREDTQPAGVFGHLQKNGRSNGASSRNLYCYNFALHTSPFTMQPSGAQNMCKFKHVIFQFVTIVPPMDPLAQTLSICDPTAGGIIGVNKNTWELYMYNFTLTVFEEKINYVVIENGMVQLMYAN